MDSAKREALLKNRDNVVAVLNVFDISDDLYSRDVILHEEYRRLLDGKLTQNARVGTLLNFILARNSNAAYEDFLELLKTDYRQLVDFIRHSERQPAPSVREIDCHETFVLGNFPKLPPYYIERTSQLLKIRTALRDLKPGETLVLHGMLLIGKSCLAAAALQDCQLLNSAFNGKVFWVNLAEVHNEEHDRDKILQELHRLLVSMGAPFDSETLTNNTDETIKVQILHAALKRVLVTPEFKQTLFVLDKLRCPNVVKYFDIGCKLLTTTCDLNLVPQSNCHRVIMMTQGFIEKETMELFQKCLEAEPQQLPHEVKQIHALCKGHPMLVSLIASYLEDSKELAVNDEYLWLDIVRQLRTQNRAELDIGNKLSVALDLCIDKLPRELKNYYVDLAVFAYDVNITSRVLETLWDLDQIAVRRKMVQLEKRALVMSFFNKELKIYVYMIHSLLLDKLRKIISKQRMVALHRKLIQASDVAVYNWDAQGMQEDDYVLQYFGYHLKEAGLRDKFSIYFDLKFIAAKIKVVGCADLLRDFQVYRKQITGGEPTLETKLEEYEKFVNEYGGILHKYRHMDIVQCALQQAAGSSVYEAAVLAARQNPDRLYFHMQLSPDTHYFTHVLELDYDITAACFTNDTDQILIGTRDGEIIMWEQHYKREICKFVGHTGRIKALLLDPSKMSFLSVSEDGVVRLWSLRSLTPRNSMGDYDGDSMPSPYLRQHRYYPFMQSDGCIERCKEFRADRPDRLVSAAFSNGYATWRRIATGSDRGEITIWDAETEEKTCVIASSGVAASCLAFSCDDSFVIFTRKKNILMYNSSDRAYVAQLSNQEDVDELLVVPKVEEGIHKIVAVNGKMIKTYKWRQDVTPNVFLVMDNETILAEDYSFTCAAVLKDGRYVVTGSTDSYLRTWDICARSREAYIEKFNEGKVVCLDTFLKDKNDSQIHILLVACADKTIKQWHVHNNIQDAASSKNLPVFATFWKNSSGTPLVAIANTDNKILIFNGYTLITETEAVSHPVKIITFALDGGVIVYGLESGEIYKFCYKTRHTTLVLDLAAPISYLNHYKDADANILFAAAANGSFAILKNDVILPYMAHSRIAICIFLKAIGTFLVVSEKRIVMSIDQQRKIEVVLPGKSHLNVAACVLSPTGRRFVCVFKNGTFEMYLVRQAGIEWEQAKKLVDGELRCCCFSFDERLLAFGAEDGGIVIWDVEEKAMLATLRLHHTAVRYLAFSPEAPYILVSLGEQIAWWNVSGLIPEAATEGKAVKGRPRLKSLDLSRQTSLTDLSVWNNKKTREDIPYLLATVKLHGTYANYVSMSPSFNSFVTVDNNGKTYIIDVFDNVH